MPQRQIGRARPARELHARLASCQLIHSGHPAFQEAFTFNDTECGAPITIGYVAEFSGRFMLKQGG